MDGLSFKDQLQLFYEADIVVSPHSASFINLIFSVPHTAVVECYPPYFYEPWYSNTVMISRLHYIMVSSFEEKNRAFFLIRRHYSDNKVNPPRFKMLSAIRDAMEYSKRWRFVYEVNDKWSPIFI